MTINRNQYLSKIIRQSRSKYLQLINYCINYLLSLFISYLIFRNYCSTERHMRDLLIHFTAKTSIKII